MFCALDRWSLIGGVRCYTGGSNVSISWLNFITLLLVQSVSLSRRFLTRPLANIYRKLTKYVA